METILTYRGQAITPSDATFIGELIAKRPGASRRALSFELCRAWGLVQPNGAPRDMVCRGLLLALHRAGHIELPAARWTYGPLRNRRRLPPAGVDLDAAPIRCSLAELGELRFEPVRRGPAEPLFDGLLQAHHYRGYTQPVGEHLKFLVWAKERPVACFAWSSAPRHLAPRDRFIGWSPEVRRKSLRLLAYNTRFLILPWVRVPHLASHLLSRMARMLPGAWERAYGHKVHFAETFVEPERFKGTCYRAANWIFLGQTTGRGKNDLIHRPNRPVKDVLGLPLTKRFRALLGGEG